ncbi:hypothetical protein HYV64_04810 [Candidatus Shapirobacteria bacterium]|nr:hypothetical protein [Candidatus Shapirobacteria bacterium]
MTLSELLKFTRQYFWNLGFEEVEVNYLNESLPLEPNLYSFETVWRNLGTKYYLPTSPEFALKNYLANHKIDCFSISHCFRDLENSGPQHHPEFIMLEWYEVHKSLNDIRTSTEKYLKKLIPEITFTSLTLPQNLPDNEPDFNQFFLNKIEPTIPKEGAVFITGYPSFLSPLAIRESGEVYNFLEHSDRDQARAEPEGSEHLKNSYTSHRFELYINGIEIANACEENRDPEQIKSAFISEQNFRQKKSLPSHPFSEKFITDSSQLPPSSGIGLGLERLLMLINHSQKI